MKKLIDINNLNIKYGEHVVISKLSFVIEEGDFLCIVGENGCGKSTLLKAITGEIESGKSIKYCGLSKNQIGYISQKARIDEFFPASVEEVVNSGSLNSPSFGIFYTEKQKAKAKRALKTLGIEKLAKENFGSLSGGQKQKALLARALTATEKLIILDEPSNNLDKESRSELYSLLQDLNREGMTVIIVTHDLDHGNLIGNKILSLSKNLPFYGATAEYVRRVHHA